MPQSASGGLGVGAGVALPEATGAAVDGARVMVGAEVARGAGWVATDRGAGAIVGSGGGIIGTQPAANITQRHAAKINLYMAHSRFHGLILPRFHRDRVSRRNAAAPDLGRP